jgi:hypothetical protein
MATVEMVFTCFDCCQTYSGAIEYPGQIDGDEEAALRYITGQRRKDSTKGPICLKCLAHWKKALSKDHMKNCLEISRKRKERIGEVVMIFSQHLRGKKDRPLQGVWIRSDGMFQEIPREARTVRPKHDEWKELKL